MTKRAAQPDVADQVGAIVHDAERLISEQIRLLRAEIGGQLVHARTAAVSLGAGAGLADAGGLLTTLMLVHGLQKATGLPAWVCYGLVGGTMGAAGAGLLLRASREIAQIDLTHLPQTKEAFRENLSWAREQVGLTS